MGVFACCVGGRFGNRKSRACRITNHVRFVEMGKTTASPWFFPLVGLSAVFSESADFFNRSRKPPLTRLRIFNILAPSSMKQGLAEKSGGAMKTKTIRVDGSARGRSSSVPADHRSELPSAWMRDGTLRLQSGVDRMSRPGAIPGLHGDQSLPETCGVLCPPGTRLFRGPFLRAERNS